jgi:cytochrome b
MLRVLTRPKMTHAGKLDESTDHAMLVVVMFYSLYRGISAESMTGTGGSVIIPFFNEAKFQELPQDLHDGLIDALHFQVSKVLILISSYCLFLTDWLSHVIHSSILLIKRISV